MKSVRPKKFLGQHFLKDLGVARAIADTVDACPNLPILEVGPGMGVLTQFLLPKGRKLTRAGRRAREVKCRVKGQNVCPESRIFTD